MFLHDSASFLVLRFTRDERSRCVCYIGCLWVNYRRWALISKQWFLESSMMSVDYKLTSTSKHAGSTLSILTNISRVLKQGFLESSMMSADYSQCLSWRIRRNVWNPEVEESVHQERGFMSRRLTWRNRRNVWNPEVEESVHRGRRRALVWALWAVIADTVLYWSVLLKSSVFVA